MPALPAVEYRICPAQPGAHLFEVSCTVRDPDPQGQVFRLPAWIPGSYMIREFARHIVTLRAEFNGEPWPIDKLDKHSWRAAPTAVKGTLSLHYEVYAWDLSVRAAHLDDSHGFFNGTSVFLAVDGRTDRPCLVDIERPSGTACRDWKVATALALARGVRGAARPYGFGVYRAADYDELIDHPVEMGNFTLG
ncbi:MAG: peptidase M61, partial [Thauera sp.]|nr:peptidase M61 [Thauera sp.]